MTAELSRVADIGGRFTERRQLGGGAMGTVYRVYDAERHAEVALKILRRVDGAALARFKREFRSLAGLVHPNLVTLYELGSVGDVWFLTMELVEGCDFLEHVRPYRQALAVESQQLDDHKPVSRTRSSTNAADSDRTTTMLTPEPGDPVSTVNRANLRAREAIVRARLDEPRLRASFAQLAQGLVALHDAGSLHCDLKPSNVLVSTQGRVLLCDFGLVADLRQESRSPEQEIAGTPAYMSPEQANGEPLGEATDWYSAGVMLYEALTGHRPFAGAPAAVLRAKLERAAAPVREIAPDAPADLAELCDALLARDPSARASRADVFTRRAAWGAHAHAVTTAGERDAVPFVGRQAQLVAIEQAFADARTGCVPVLLAGLSGMGKTSLARAFLERAQQDPRVLVLAGRCYQNESVPYKAIDALVDSLGSYLAGLPEPERQVVMRDEAHALARLFPVLARLEEGRPPGRDESGDSQQLRQRAFDGLTRILARIAQTRPTVLFIDDLQWGDLDSAAFLAGLAQARAAAPVLLLVTYRTDEQATSPLLRALLDSDSVTCILSQARTIAVDSLADDEARALATSIVRDQGRSASSLDAILRESRGHPLFLSELARAVGAAREPHDDRPVALDALLQDRVRALPAEARALMMTTALVGRPMPVSLLAQAAELQDEPAAAAVLLAQHLVRSRRREGIEQFEPYHDRIREASIALLSADEARAYHARIASVLEREPDGDPLPLAEHWLAAGELQRAGVYVAEAAARAERALAFSSAARLHRLHLELVEGLDDDRRRIVQVKLADALSNAGALVEAADAFRAAADGAPTGVAINLRARAAGELIRSGKLDEGLALAQAVLQEVGLKLPKGRVRILAGLLLRRAWVAVRGLRFHDVPPEDWSEHVAHRIDACQAVAGGLSTVLPVHGAYFHARQLLWARRLGDPRRFALALNLEVGFRSLAGARSRPAVVRIVAQATKLGERAGGPVVAGFAVGGNGLSAFLAGDFTTAFRDCFLGASMLRFDAPSIDSGPDLRWQRRIFELYGLAAAQYLGKMSEVIEMVPPRLRLALETGDEYIAKALRAWRTNLMWLALDDVDEAQRQAEAGAPPPVTDTFTIQHYYQMLTRCQINLYRGDVEPAWQRAEQSWLALRRTMHLRLQSVRVEGAFLRARCALAGAAVATTPRDSRDRLAIARAAGNALAREPVAWSQALATLVRATLEHRAARPEAACALLVEAATRCEQAGLGLHAAVARRRLAELRGADAIAIAREDAHMVRAGVRAPARFAGLYAPGWGA